MSYLYKEKRGMEPFDRNELASAGAKNIFNINDDAKEALKNKIRLLREAKEGPVNNSSGPSF